ncbi:ABC transporter substrate-binding protein [Cohnella rhizoplanae]|uniref:ABC transporter substrate-binding protein n=1 Tax=Cohnella rhizoplanae TaxID=2974897 RepID=UPI0022FFC071|nr:ABC transporter substrate-binding protein [Cohnella sp. JJ-181]CAI6086153.1 Riboflavin-binding protein RibY [Cohnella sp. JJ-181]
MRKVSKVNGKWMSVLLLSGVVAIAGCGSNNGSNSSSNSNQAPASESASSTTSAAAPSASADSGTQKLKKVVVRLKWINQAQFAGFYIAKEKGYYKDAGLDVEIRAGGADFPSVQMVSSGSEDFGVTGADQILMSREKGAPVVALSVIYRSTPFVLFTLKSSGITSVKDLEGQKVGVKLGGNEELTYRAMVKKAGIKAKSISEMPVKYDLSPLLTGQVKAWPGYVINEVIAAQEQGQEVNVIYPSDYGINFYADTLFTTEKMIQKDPETVKGFTQATMKGWDYAIQHPDEAAQVTVQYGDQLNLEHETKMMNASIPLLEADKSPLGSMEDSEWNTLQDSLIDVGFLRKKQDLSTAFTNEFIQP